MSSHGDSGATAGGNILNATNPTLSISPTLPGSVGGYDVVVTNPYASATSQVANQTGLQRAAQGR